MKEVRIMPYSKNKLATEDNGSANDEKTKKVRGGYQKMKEVRIMPYSKNKLATDRVYVHREEDW